MASTYSTSLKLELIGNGDQPGTWGTTTNNNLGTLLEQAITGVQSIVMTNTNYTLTNFNGASDEARNAVLYVTGTNSQVRSIIAPSVNKVYIIRNATTGGYAIDIKTSGGAGLSVANGSSAIVYCDGTDFFYGTTADKVSLGVITSPTGSEIIPVGTTAQRDAIPVIGYFRYNSTISGFEGVSANAGVTISTITKSGTTATLTTATNHELATNDYVIITGAVSSDYNGTFQITVTSDTEFTYTMATTPASDASVVGTYQNIYWGSIGGGATGAGGNQIFVENEQTVTNSYTIPSGKNASSTGDITINTGVTVTVPSESRWVIL